LPPDAAATVAALHYATTTSNVPPGGSGQSKAESSKATRRGKDSSLTATCTATKLWGALALRDIQLRDLQPAAATQRYGHGVKDFLEQQTVMR